MPVLIIGTVWIFTGLETCGLSTTGVTGIKGISSICIPRLRIFRYLCITACLPTVGFHLFVMQYHLLAVELLQVPFGGYRPVI